MLAGELQAYNRRVDAGEVSGPAPPPPSLPQTAPPSLADLHISQSLPTGGHFAFGGKRGPPRPRMGPTKMTNLSQLPILELPEPSPHSNSLLDPQFRPLDVGESIAAANSDEEDDEFECAGGTCVTPRPHRALRPQRALVHAASSHHSIALRCVQEHA